MGSLFDNDEDVEIASTRSCRSRHYSASSGASQPPTSESEGMFDGRYGEDGDDDEDDAKELPARTSVRPQPSKPSAWVNLSKRDAALKSEVCVLLIILLF